MNKKCIIFIVFSFWVFDLMAFSGSEKINQYQPKKLAWQYTPEEIFSDTKVRALAKAAAKGDTKKLAKLIDSGVDINSKGKIGITPIFWPLLQSNFVGFEYLINAGAKVNIVFSEDYGCLIGFAAHHKDPRFLKLLLDNGANANQQCGTFNRTPLYRTLEENESAALKRKYLYNAGAKINITTPSLVSPFVKGDITSPFNDALSSGYYLTALELLKNGADPYLKFPDDRYITEESIKNGERVLLRNTTAWKNFEKLKRLLQENAPDLNISD